MLRCYLMDPDTDVCQTEQPQISYSFDFAAEQNGAIQPIQAGGYRYRVQLTEVVYIIPHGVNTRFSRLAM